MLSLFILWLASVPLLVFAAKAGSFADGGQTLVSAMMMFLGNEEKVYILDKAEGNAAQVAGHPAWGSVWDINSHQAVVMDVKTNVFCASGMHLPNGSYMTFGGNTAVARGGGAGSQGTVWDSEYQDFDGSKAIRVLNPCTSDDDMASEKCRWFDEPGVLTMQKQRWYSAAEALADGTVVIIGGFVGGGYINRNTINSNPAGDGSEPTYEFIPANGRVAQIMDFMVSTSGLNAFAHTFLMGSGKMLVQANISTILWDYDNNQETQLPGMPGNVVRVYPGSGAVAMLPLTPANNYTPTILFCGGSDMNETSWGNYSFPYIDTWNYPASQDCQRLTPEPTDGSPVQYVKDDDLLEGRTMGQFITLPNGKMLLINGGLNGTAGYSNRGTGQTLSYGAMPFGMSLATGPVGTPAIYDPNAPKGSRWSNAGLDKSPIARLYHSSAILLPDASVLVAGSNPNVDVNTSTIYPTEYRAEIFYPSYFSAATRPVPSGVPKNISYGGDPFDITIPASSFSGLSNDAADNTTVVLIRGGFTTHAMNMGQRYMQLNNTYTVQKDGSYVLHVAQAPPNPHLFQPGPALLFVTVHGIPSNGTMIIIGSGQIGTQPTAAVSVLPPSVRIDSVSGTAGGASTSPGNQGGSNSGSGNTTSGSTSHTGAIVGGVIGGLAAIGILGALAGICLARRRRSLDRQAPSASYAMTAGGQEGFHASRGMQSYESTAFMPLKQEDHNQIWNASTTSLAYRDDSRGAGSSTEFDPYNNVRR